MPSVVRRWQWVPSKNFWPARKAKEFTLCGAFAALSAMTMSPWLVRRVIVYFFAGSIVIGGSLGQLLAATAGAEDVSEDGAEDEPEEAESEEAESEEEAGAEAVLSEAAEDPAEPIEPEEAQPDSRSPPASVAMPMPILWRRGILTRAGYLNVFAQLFSPLIRSGRPKYSNSFWSWNALL